jgi:hypothetical protein
MTENYSTLKFSEVSWAVSDLKKLCPNWSLDACYEWLALFEEDIADRMRAAGSDFIVDMLNQVALIDTSYGIGEQDGHNEEENR